jgi:hypothetical protein
VVILTAIYYIGIVFLSLVRGGVHYDSIVEIDPCWAIGWGIVAGEFVISVVVSKIIINKIQREAREEKELHVVH